MAKKVQNINFLRLYYRRMIFDAVLDQPIQLSAGGTYPVKAFFTNPLSRSLTNIMFHIEGAKLTKSQKISGRYVCDVNHYYVGGHTCIYIYRHRKSEPAQFR